jgi:hypothetical protein
MPSAEPPEPRRLGEGDATNFFGGALFAVIGVVLCVRPGAHSQNSIVAVPFGLLFLGLGLYIAHSAFWTRTVRIDPHRRKLSVVFEYPPFSRSRRVYPLTKVLGARAVTTPGTRRGPPSHHVALVLRDGDTVGLGRRWKREGVRGWMNHGSSLDLLREVTEIVDAINADLSALGVDTKLAEPAPDPPDPPDDEDEPT